MSATTLERVIITSIVSQVAPGAGRAVLEATREMVESAPTVNEQGRVAKLLSLGDHLRSSVCAAGLRAVGDTTRADLAAVHSVIDTNSAAVAATSLGDYREFIDTLPTDNVPQARRADMMQLRAAATNILAETIAVLHLVADATPNYGVSEQDEVAAGRHAASAICVAWEAGIVMDLPARAQTLLYGLQTVVAGRSVV